MAPNQSKHSHEKRKGSHDYKICSKISSIPDPRNPSVWVLRAKWKSSKGADKKSAKYIYTTTPAFNRVFRSKEVADSFMNIAAFREYLSDVHRSGPGGAPAKSGGSAPSPSDLTPKPRRLFNADATPA